MTEPRTCGITGRPQNRGQYRNRAIPHKGHRTNIINCVKMTSDYEQDYMYFPAWITNEAGDSISRGLFDRRQLGNPGNIKVD